MVAATFALGVACGGSVSDEAAPSTAGSGGTASGGSAGAAGAANVDCASLDEPRCAGEPDCVVVWRNDQIVEMAGPPPPSIGGGLDDPCCIGCQDQECVTCHEPRFVGCRLRASACTQTENELCGYLAADACKAD